jgi:hypothetical protein
MVVPQVQEESKQQGGAVCGSVFWAKMIVAALVTDTEANDILSGVKSEKMDYDVGNGYILTRGSTEQTFRRTIYNDN